MMHVRALSLSDMSPQGSVKLAAALSEVLDRWIKDETSLEYDLDISISKNQPVLVVDNGELLFAITNSTDLVNSVLDDVKIKDEVSDELQAKIIERIAKELIENVSSVFESNIEMDRVEINEVEYNSIDNYTQYGKKLLLNLGVQKVQMITFPGLVVKSSRKEKLKSSAEKLDSIIKNERVKLEVVVPEFKVSAGTILSLEKDDVLLSESELENDFEVFSSQVVVSKAALANKQGRRVILLKE